ncbi:MAG: hypothetical protein ABFC94_16745 [Syntrophomonas sp.]
MPVLTLIIARLRKLPQSQGGEPEIVLVLLGFVGFGYLQISSLAKKEWWRELAVFTVLWMAGFILSSL